MNIQQLRLHNQRIAYPPSAQPSEIVAWLGAIQGQDYSGAKWSLGLRVPGSTDARIEAAIADKTIVRTWAMRGTLHLVAAADVRWLVALVGPRLIASCARRYRELELDAETLARSNTLLTQALIDNELCTRTELLAMLEHNGISTQGQRGVYMLQRASLDGLICQGVARRNTPTFMLLAALPHSNPLTRAEALAELALRYFVSRGPATLPDFTAWSGLPMGDVRAGLAAVAAQLAQVIIDGQTYWMSPSVPQPHAGAQQVYVLPGFDEYLLGYRDRRAVLDPQHASLIVPGGNGIFNPTIVSNGRVVGIWKRVFKKQAVAVTAELFHAISEAETQLLHAAIAAYARFLELPLLFE